MIRTFRETTPPAKLLEYFDANLCLPGFALRRRSVLTRSDQSTWTLLMCVVQAFPDPALCPEAIKSRRYDHVILLEDWLDQQLAGDFVAEVQQGSIALGDVTLVRQGGPYWQTDLVSSQNSFMERVGFVVQTRFEVHSVSIPQEPLVSASEPYYPDATSAADDWLGLTQYHGSSDARNCQIVFLLPEARAFFTSAISDNGVLRLSAAGSETSLTGLKVKGAYYEGRKIHHFEKDVLGNRVELEVPDESDRLDYVLIDSKGDIYDIQREAWGTHSGMVRKRIGKINDALIQQILDAREVGEGEEIEFKPFIDPDQKVGPVKNKTKFREILRTIAAFANTRGGCIFLGIEDDCKLTGIQEDLAKWGKSEIGEDLIARYKGAFTNKIRGELVGDARFRFAFATAEDATIGIIVVSPFEHAPVGLKDEGLCYVRRGSNNKHLSPHEWLTAFAGRS